MHPVILTLLIPKLQTVLHTPYSTDNYCCHHIRWLPFIHLSFSVYPGSRQAASHPLDTAQVANRALAQCNGNIFQCAILVQLG